MQTAQADAVSKSNLHRESVSAAVDAKQIGVFSEDDVSPPTANTS